MSGFYRNTTLFLRLYFKSSLLMWRASKVEPSLILLGLILQGLVPTGSVYIISQIVNKVAISIKNNEALSLNDFVLLIILWVLIVAIDSLINPWLSMLQGNLNDKLTAYINLTVMEKAQSLPGLKYFEDPSFHNQIQLIQNGNAFQPLNLLIYGTNAFREFITIASLSLLLLPIELWLPALIIFASLPQAYLSFQLQQSIWETMSATSPFTRRMKYVVSIMLNQQYSKEIRVFNTGDFFKKNYENAFQQMHHDMSQIRLKQSQQSSQLTLISVIGNAFAFYWTLQKVISGKLQVGNLILFAQSLAYIQQNLLLFIQDVSMLYGTLLYMQNYFDFIVSEPDLTIYPNPLETREINSIQFKDVEFSYSNKPPALKNINCEIKKGETIALVGENGAGKTTLIKLLLRLYDPTTGEVLINQQNLKKFDLEEFRKNVVVVFQDFGTYALTVKENILFGRPLASEGSLKDITDKANISGFIETMVNTFDTQLGKEFGGTELSGGQWQKIALARAFARQEEAQIVILDEPTASLDPRSEHEVYQQFAKLMSNKITILITHRLSSVKMADRIFVLKDGCIVEVGTHAELLQNDKEYATLWNIQASQYQSDTD